MEDAHTKAEQLSDRITRLLPDLRDRSDLLLWLVGYLAYDDMFKHAVNSYLNNLSP